MGRTSIPSRPKTRGLVRERRRTCRLGVVEVDDAGAEARGGALRGVRAVSEDDDAAARNERLRVHAERMKLAREAEQSGRASFPRFDGANRPTL